MSDQSSSAPAQPPWAAFVGIDWADQKHCWSLQPAEGGKVERGEVENSPEALGRWAAELERRFAGQPIAVGLEQPRGAVAYKILQYRHLVLHFVPPDMMASYRKAFSTSGAKSDPRDADLILELVVRHRDHLPVSKPDDPKTRLLHLLVEDRRGLVDEKTRLVLRLIDCLKQYFPQILRWFPDPESPLVAALLTRWGDLDHLQHSHPGTVRRFFRQHHCHGQDLLEQRLQAIYAATPATTDEVLVEAYTRKARHLVKQLALLREQIATLEKRIDELVKTHPDAPLFDALPGAGKVTVPRLIVAFGTDRDRYDSAYQLLCYSGIAPVREASGKSEVVRFRRACPKFLRQTFHEFAAQSLRFCQWAKAFYDHQRDRGKSHHAAVRALAYKWIRILFRCWKNRKPYDEQQYIDSLRRRGALLTPALTQATATNFAWKKVAGFQKLSENPS